MLHSVIVESCFAPGAFRAHAVLRPLGAKTNVEAPVLAMLRDWYRAVRPAVEDQVLFTTKRTQTPPDRVWVIVGSKRAVPTKEGVGELTGCHPKPRTSQSNGRPR